MGDVGYMEEQIQDKLEKGFHCIKLKIGVDWKSEHEVLQKLRQKFSKESLNFVLMPMEDLVKKKQKLFYSN
jgi:hypothetical protein